MFCRIRPLLGEERVDNDGEILHIEFPDKDNKMLELKRLDNMSVNEVTLVKVPFDSSAALNLSQYCVKELFIISFNIMGNLIIKSTVCDVLVYSCCFRLLVLVVTHRINSNSLLIASFDPKTTRTSFLMRFRN